MDLLEAQRYSGAVSSHSWSTADVIPRIYKLGGVVTPMKEAAPDWIKTWRRRRPSAIPGSTSASATAPTRTASASQRDPRNGPNPVQYPFKSFDGKRDLPRQRSGVREFDINKDGVAHYGLFPDWREDLGAQAGSRGRDMARGSEAYLQAGSA